MAQENAPKANRLREIADKKAKDTTRRLRVSFKHLDFTTYGFFAHGGDSAFYQHLFDCIERIQSYTEDDIRTQRAGDLVPKCINWDHDYITQKSFPGDLATDSVFTQHKFEMRITKNLGRVHGFSYANTFYIVWIDPCHNLFPGKENNKIKRMMKPEEYVKVKAISPEVVNELTAELEQQRIANRELMELLDTATK